MIVSKVEVFETGQACQGVGGQGDYGVVRQVEGGERGQAQEGLVLHLLHGVALQAEAGQPGEGGEGVRGDLADRVEGEVEGAQVGREEVKTWRREGAWEQVRGQVEVGEVREVLHVELVDRTSTQLVASQLWDKVFIKLDFQIPDFSPGEFAGAALLGKLRPQEPWFDFPVVRLCEELSNSWIWNEECV